MPHNRADVVLARCSRDKQTYGMRFEEVRPRAWRATWAFPLGAGAAAREGYDTGGVEGEIELDEGFPGCPHCGDRGFVLCRSCDRVGCHPPGGAWFRCPWCSQEGTVEGRITSLRTVGD